MPDSNQYRAAGSIRWTSRLKVELLERVANGEIGDAELAFMGISREELEEWRRLFKKDGRPALRATRLQSYRDERGGRR